MTRENAKPTPERLRHAGADAARLTDRPMRIDADPLDKLKSRGSITKAQHDAGTLLFEHYFSSGLHVSGVASYCDDKVDNSRSDMSASEAQTHHADAYLKAVKTLTPGAEHDLVVNVVIHHDTIDEAGAISGYSQKRDRTTAGMTLLRTGLDRLADHFGLSPAGEARRRRHARVVEGGKPAVREDMWEKRREPSKA